MFHVEHSNGRGFWYAMHGFIYSGRRVFNPRNHKDHDDSKGTK